MSRTSTPPSVGYYWWFPDAGSQGVLTNITNIDGTYTSIDLPNRATQDVSTMGGTWEGPLRPQGEPDAMPGPDAFWAMEASALLTEFDRLLGNWIVLRTLAGGSEAELSVFATLVKRIKALRAGQGAPDLAAMKRAFVAAWPRARITDMHGQEVELPDAPFIAALQAAWGERP